MKQVSLDKKGKQIISMLLGVLLLCGCSDGMRNQETTQQTQEETGIKMMIDDPQVQEKLADETVSKLENIWLNERISVNASVTPPNVYAGEYPVYAVHQWSDESELQDRLDRLLEINPLLTETWNPFDDSKKHYYEINAGISQFAIRVAESFYPGSEIDPEIEATIGTAADAAAKLEAEYSGFIEGTLNKSQCYFDTISGEEWKAYQEYADSLLVPLTKADEKLMEQDAYLIYIPYLQDELELSSPRGIIFLYTEDGVAAVISNQNIIIEKEIRKLSPVSIKTVLEQFQSYAEEKWGKNPIDIKEIHLVYADSYMDSDSEQNNDRNEIFWPVWQISYEKFGSSYKEIFYAATGTPIKEEYIL